MSHQYSKCRAKKKIMLHRLPHLRLPQILNQLISRRSPVERADSRDKVVRSLIRGAKASKMLMRVTPLQLARINQLLSKGDVSELLLIKPKLRLKNPKPGRELAAVDAPGPQPRTLLPARRLDQQRLANATVVEPLSRKKMTIRALEQNLLSAGT